MLARGWILTVVAVATALNAAAAPRIELAEADRHVRAGTAATSLTRTIVLTNATTAALQSEIVWKTLVGPAVVQTGKFDIAAAPGATVRRAVSLRIPPVRRAVSMAWLIQAGAGPIQNIQFKIYPASSGVSWDFLKGKTIGVHEAGTIFRDFLTSRGATVVAINSPDDAGYHDDCNLLLIQSDPGDSATWDQYLAKWGKRPESARVRAPLLMFVRNVGTTKTLAAGRIVAQGHPLFQGLTDQDFAAWRNQGVISSATLPFDQLAAKRLIAPSDVGTTDSLLAETADLRGWPGYVSTLLIGEKLNREPACELILNQWIRVAIEAQPYAIHKKIPAAGLGHVIEDDPDLDDREQLKKNMRLVEEGAEVLVVDLSPQYEADGLRRWALGDAMPVAATMGTTVTLTDPNDPLLWGTDAANWQAAAGHRSKYQLPHVDSPDFKMLVEPGIMAVRKIGKGRIAIIQIDSDFSGILNSFVMNQVFLNLHMRAPDAKAQANN